MAPTAPVDRHCFGFRLWKLAGSVALCLLTIQSLLDSLLSLELHRRIPEFTTETTKLIQRHHRKPVDNNTRYYFLHISKAGGTTMSKYFRQVKNLFATRDFGPSHNRLVRTQPNFTWWMEQQDPNVRVFITEGGGYAQQPPPHALTVFREPVSHVLSMYYHCTESRMSTKYRRRTMEDRQQWLQTWDRIRMHYPQEFDPFSKTASNKSLAMSFWYNSSHFNRFQCYIPINFQSRLVGHYDVQTKQQLSEKFHVVGITDDLEGSACLFFVQVLQRVPSLCDCSDYDASVGNNQTATRKAPLKIIQRVQHVDHGVGHHGDASRKTLSAFELALIRNMTQLDQRLYEHAKELFQKQVARVEQTYKVKLCRRSAAPGTAE